MSIMTLIVIVLTTAATLGLFIAYETHKQKKYLKELNDEHEQMYETKDV